MSRTDDDETRPYPSRYSYDPFAAARVLIATLEALRADLARYHDAHITRYLESERARRSAIAWAWVCAAVALSSGALVYGLLRALRP